MLCTWNFHTWHSDLSSDLQCSRCLAQVLEEAVEVMEVVQARLVVQKVVVAVEKE